MAGELNQGLLNCIKKWFLVPKDSTDMLSDIKNNYESIFSWNIYETIGRFKAKGSNFWQKLQQKQDLSFNTKSKFNFDLYLDNY